jgi:hypothetical protein
MTIHWQDDTVTLHHGHALDVARTLPTASRFAQPSLGVEVGA